MLYKKLLLLAILSLLALVNTEEQCVFTKIDNHLKCSDFTSYSDLNWTQLNLESYILKKLTLEASNKNSFLSIDSNLDFSIFNFYPMPRIIIRNFKGKTYF